MCMELTSAGYFILASLQDGPLHGYGIIKRAKDISNGRVELAVGTLYGVIDRLVSNGLIVLASEEIVDGRARRSYELTAFGTSELHAEAARLAQAASVVKPAAQASAKLRPSQAKLRPA
jgi:PadR family transcriptional regulator, regulatory protein PadR